jgi:hypothetical protein
MSAFEEGFQPRRVMAPERQSKMRELKPISAAEILAAAYPPIRWAVEEIMPEGFALLAGRPKIGKSWLALGMAVSVVHGAPFLGKFPTTRGSVLYAALEDSPRRVQARLRALGLTSMPAELDFLFDLPRIGDGGLEALAAWFDENPDTRLAIIDVYNRIKSPRSKGAEQYQHDAEQAAMIQKLATSVAVPLLMLHHDRKAGAEDWLDSISGTLGTAGSADAVMLLERDRDSSNGRLRITGRDLEERDLGLEFRHGIWSFLGSGDVVELTPERRRIVEAIPVDSTGLSPTEISLRTEQLGLRVKVDTVKGALRDLLRDGHVKKLDYGKYVRGSALLPVSSTLSTLPFPESGQNVQSGQNGKNGESGREIGAEG